jgi:hypothetical protein
MPALTGALACYVPAPASRLDGHRLAPNDAGGLPRGPRPNAGIEASSTADRHGESLAAEA